MPGNYSRVKGRTRERQTVQRFQEAGFAAEKFSWSRKPGHDISVPLLGVDRKVEVKSLANGFRRLHDWLAGKKSLGRGVKKPVAATPVDMLVLIADRQEPLVVLPWRVAVDLFSAAEKQKATNP